MRTTQFGPWKPACGARVVERTLAEAGGTLAGTGLISLIQQGLYERRVEEDAPVCHA